LQWFPEVANCLIPFVSDHSQLDAFKQHTPYQLFNGAENSSNTQDNPCYPAASLAPVNASQQHSHISAASKDINQTMTFVSQIEQ
jgi:hypothetical protein